MKHIVEFRESERGWGGEIWYSGFDTLEEAKERIAECNKDLPTDRVPDYYIVATYAGVAETVPTGYKC